MKKKSVRERVKNRPEKQREQKVFYRCYEFYMIIVLVFLLVFLLSVLEFEKPVLQPSNLVGIDASSSGSTFQKSITISHTTTNTQSNRYMLVGISFENNLGESILSIKYNGVSLTKIGQANYLNDFGRDLGRAEIWALKDADLPNDGITHDVVIDFTKDGTTTNGVDLDAAVAGVVTFYNVDQTTPLQKQDNDGSPYVVEKFIRPVGNPGDKKVFLHIDTDVDNMIFAITKCDECSSLTLDSGQTEQWNVDVFDEFFGSGVTGLAVSFTEKVEWSMNEISSSHPVMLGVSVRPSDSSVRDVGDVVELAGNDGTWVHDLFVNGMTFTQSYGVDANANLLILSVAMENQGNENVSRTNHPTIGTGASQKTFSKIGHVQNADSGKKEARVELWYVGNPPTGTQDLNVKFEGTANSETETVIGIIGFKNVDISNLPDSGIETILGVGDTKNGNFVTTSAVVGYGFITSGTGIESAPNHLIFSSAVCSDEGSFLLIQRCNVLIPFNAESNPWLNVQSGSARASSAIHKGGLSLYDVAWYLNNGFNAMGSVSLISAGSGGNGGGGATCGNGVVESGEECDDNNAVSGDGCSSICTVEECSGNLDCDDFLFCNGQETCNANFDCVPGMLPVVNDGISCTVDSCDEVSDQVIHIPNHAACYDGLYCNGAEACQVGVGCVTGIAVLCGDGLSCTIDSCDEGQNTGDNAGQCVNTGIDNDNDGFNICPSLDFDCDDTNLGVNKNAPEICDLTDNDCDGTIDEGCACVSGETRQCGTSDAGECSFGLQNCVSNIWGNCVGNVEPVAEICDALDNDCDSIIDNELTSPMCALQLGVCSGSVQICAGFSGWLECIDVDYGADYEFDEASCNDGLDNDCNGLTDCEESNCVNSVNCDTVAENVCGDGILDFNEECDDGNVFNGDGCSYYCLTESGYTCDTSLDPSACFVTIEENTEEPQVTSYKVIETINEIANESKVGRVAYWIIILVIIGSIGILLWRLVVRMKKFHEEQYAAPKYIGDNVKEN